MIFSLTIIDFKQQLWDEIWSFETYVSGSNGGNMSHDEVMRLPIHLRKYYIQRHNEKVKKEKEEFERNNKKKHN